MSVLLYRKDTQTGVKSYKGGNVYIKLKQAREEQGLSQKAVAKRAGITERGYQNYELGLRKPNVDTAICIAKALNRTVEELFE